MVSFDDAFSAFWALVWGWTKTHYPIIIVGLLTVVLVLPVVFMATKTIARGFCRHNDIRASNVLPVAVPHHGKIMNALHGGAPRGVEFRSRMEVLEEGLPVSPVSPPPSLLQMTFPNVQPPPCSDQTRMLRTLKAMYVLLGQTLDGATNSLSAVERMNAACSLVSRTVATFKGWRASTAVVALLQPAKDVTDLFSHRYTKNGSGAMSRRRQAHYVALLKKRAQTMEEVISQALWAGTMPAVPTTIQDAVPLLALAEKLGSVGHKKRSTTRKHSRKGKAPITPGVQFVPYSSLFQLGDSQILQ